jgi:hypothetical protein
MKKMHIQIPAHIPLLCAFYLLECIGLVLPCVNCLPTITMYRCFDVCFVLGTRKIAPFTSTAIFDTRQRGKD